MDVFTKTWLKPVWQLKVFGSVMGTKQPGYVIFMAVVKKGRTNRAG